MFNFTSAYRLLLFYCYPQFKLQLISAMLRDKIHSHKLPCYREHCCGISNHQDNYLNRPHNTSTSNSKNKPKTKRSKTKKQKKTNESKDMNIMRESFQSVLEEKRQLLKKLGFKKKKIDELKNKVAELEAQLKQTAYREKKNNYASDEKKDLKIVHQSQKLAKETLEKYRKLEDQFMKYRETAQKKIDKLRADNHRLMTEGADKAYNKEIQQLKKELYNFKQEQLAVSSMKNLHNHSNGLEQKYKFEISTLKLNISSLKNENIQLKQYTSELEKQLEERRQCSQTKQNELRNNLDAINLKIQNWEQEYHEMKQQSSKWEQMYYQLLEKYKVKKQKYKTSNQEWAYIFRQFLIEIEKLKEEYDIISARNIRLVKMYGNDQ